METDILVDSSEPSSHWQERLTEREIREIHLAVVYHNHFHHGTTGHNQLMLIAKLSEILDRAEASGMDINSLFDSQTEKG